MTIATPAVIAVKNNVIDNNVYVLRISLLASAVDKGCGSNASSLAFPNGML
ncbi:hypothetical protein BGP_6241 [Beggiatoa sp. PS]|nr:hypothetical protein BGP_6241 [Beggiatoa sp. PS]